MAAKPPGEEKVVGKKQAHTAAGPSAGGVVTRKMAREAGKMDRAKVHDASRGVQSGTDFEDATEGRSSPGSADDTPGSGPIAVVLANNKKVSERRKAERAQAQRERKEKGIDKGKECRKVLKQHLGEMGEAMPSLLSELTSRHLLSSDSEVTDSGEGGSPPITSTPGLAAVHKEDEGARPTRRPAVDMAMQVDESPAAGGGGEPVPTPEWSGDVAALARDVVNLTVSTSPCPCRCVSFKWGTLRGLAEGGYYNTLSMIPPGFGAEAEYAAVTEATEGEKKGETAQQEQSKATTWVARRERAQGDEGQSSSPRVKQRKRMSAKAETLAKRLEEISWCEGTVHPDSGFCGEWQLKPKILRCRVRPTAFFSDTGQSAPFGGRTEGESSSGFGLSKRTPK